MVFGTHHISGIKWFLWDSQFGRFVNNGPISRKASGSIFFYLHTLLWAFAPWCLLFYYAVFKNVKEIYQHKKLTEYYALSGGILLCLLFSLSRFQLPFYTNAVFPLFAIITAPFCYKQLSRFGTKLRLIGQWVFVILLPVVILLLNFLLKPGYNLFFLADCILTGIFIIIVFVKIKEAHKRVFFFNCAAALFVGFYLNTVFYSVLVPYKGEITAAEYINQRPFDGFQIYSVKAGNNIFQFYCKRPVDLIPIEQFNNFKPKNIPVFYVNQQSMDYLNQMHANYRIVRSFINYPQENILPAFINEASRFKVLDHVYLITK